jgi:hypothetical protein
MKGIFIADLKVLPCRSRVDADRLAARQVDIVRELCQLVPRLADLHFGTLDHQWVFGDDSCWLRLQLVPRRYSLFDPLSAPPSKPRSLQDEARLVWTDICNSRLRTLQAASGLERWSRFSTPTPLDPLHELAFRLSRRQWIFEAESGQLCLEFPEVPRYLVDHDPSQIHGVVDAVFSRAIVMRQARIGPSDIASSVITLPGPLRIVPDRNGAEPKRGVPWQLTSQVSPGESLSLPAKLHRCRLSRRVVGAVASDTIGT